MDDAGPRTGALADAGTRPWSVAGWVRAYPLPSYVLLTHALSWAYWVPLVMTGTSYGSVRR